MLDVKLSDNNVTPQNLDIEIDDDEFLTATAPRDPSIRTDGSTSNENSPILTRTQFCNMPNKITYQINGVTFTVEDNAIKCESETLYTKAKRKAYQDKERNELLDKIQKSQQTEFHSITISVNDPEKITNTHSLAKLLAEKNVISRSTAFMTSTTSLSQNTIGSDISTCNTFRLYWPSRRTTIYKAPRIKTRREPSIHPIRRVPIANHVQSARHVSMPNRNIVIRFQKQ